MFTRVTPSPALAPSKPAAAPAPQPSGPQPLAPQALAQVAGGGTPKGSVGTNGWSWG